MKPLLIFGFGSSITVSKRRLNVINPSNNEKLEFYPHQIPYDSIIIDGNYGMITFEAIRWLMKHDIPLITLNWNGNLLSVTLPKELNSGKLRLKQYQKTLDDNEKRKIALSFLNEKISKSIDLLSKLSNYYDFIDKTALSNSFEKVNMKFKGSPDLLTYEGNIAILYWNELQKVFNKLYPEFNFTNRNGRKHSWNMNASDEINALLNYGYAILESKIKVAINSVGLDPAISFLHETKDGRASLVYDLQELYRWLIDLSVIQLLEDKKIKKSDFIVTENYNIRLSSKASKALLEKITPNFNKSVYYKGKNHSYEFILLDNVRSLARYVIGKGITLPISSPEIELKRYDITQLRNRIIQMTPEKRRTLGLNKSTLWYQQKRIKEGKTIKIYNKVKRKL